MGERNRARLYKISPLTAKSEFADNHLLIHYIYHFSKLVKKRSIKNKNILK